MALWYTAFIYALESAENSYEDNGGSREIALF